MKSLGERKLIFIESFSFFLFFSSSENLLRLMIAFTFPPKKKNSRNLNPPIQDRLSLLSSKSIWHNFVEKYSKISVFLAPLICS